jgi:hypothetical protein
MNIRKVKIVKSVFSYAFKEVRGLGIKRITYSPLVPFILAFTTNLWSNGNVNEEKYTIKIEI